MTPPGGEFAPTLSKAGAGNAPLSAHAKFAEVRLHPRLSHQPLQHRPQSLLTRQLQEEPRRRSRRVAWSLHGIRHSVAVLAETSSSSSGSTDSRTEYAAPTSLGPIPSPGRNPIRVMPA